jgi:hypothetical protein
MKPQLTIPAIQREAGIFARLESDRWDAALFGTTDGKAIGTYLEHKFQTYLQQRYTFQAGSSARGIDFPELGVDMKVTSLRRPQSSCPFRSARQKIYGLGYALLVFVYDKTDNQTDRTGRLEIVHTIFVETERTADYQTTTGLLQILENNGNVDDIMAFLYDRRLPIEEIQAEKLAEEVITHPPSIGYLTISNALQWRLQYRRAIENAGDVSGIHRIR